MADTDETPLLSGAALAPPLAWPHYLGLGLVLLYVVAALLSSLASLPTFVAGVLLLVALAHSAHKFHARHAPPRAALPARFLIAQLALGVFVAPIGAALVAFAVILALLLPTLLALFLVVAAFSAKYPDAAVAFGECMDQLDAAARAGLGAHASHVTRMAAGGTRLVHTAARYMGQSVRDQQQQYAHGHDTAAPVGPGLVWQRMVDAGAAPADLGAMLFVLVLIFIAFVLCATVAVNAAREFARWKLFKRYTVLCSDEDADDAAVARSLGVRGVVVTAMVGAFGMALTGALSGLMSVSTASKPGAELAAYLPSYEPSFYAAVVYLVNALVDVAVFVGSMLYVGTAFAKKAVLGDPDVDMRKAWTTSVVYNLALGALRVGTPGPGTPTPTPLVVFVLVTLVRTGVMFKFSKKARARFVTACAAEDLPSAQQQQVEDA